MVQIKTIAMYLPQFHRIPENDKWWGEGYTEWTAVKGATPLFENHYQPHIPLNDNYYDLMNKSTMLWQSELMHKYQIDVMCFYHYYFKNGRKILEKPAENLLNWKDVNMPFCFSWANESWVRSWSNISGNAWNEKYENKRNNSSDSGVLIQQDYGDEIEWEKHFYYLLPFFRDKRYLRKDNKPVFIIYQPDDIPCLGDMINCWKNLACTCGLQGVYFIGGNSRHPIFDAFIMQQPSFSLRQRVYLRNDYKEISNQIIADSLNANNKTFLSGFVSYDDTPRRGKNGLSIENSVPSIFYKQLLNLYSISEKAGKEFVFINAWNEWGEGMHLEPDEKYGYEYLNYVKKAKLHFKELSKEYMENLALKDINTIDDREQEMFRNLMKYKSHYSLLNKWMTLREAGINLEIYFHDKGINTIALYGIGILGKHFYSEMRGTDINIKYGIDRLIREFDNLDIFQPNNKLPSVDAIIVTPVDEFEEIRNHLKLINKTEIVSLEEIISYCLMHN